MKTQHLLALGVLCGWAGLLPAATPLFTFETEADLAAWKWNPKNNSHLERSTSFATEGATSLKFTSPAWKKGQPEWPSFEVRPPVTNWTAYDRLVVDITNPSAERYFFSVFISDSQVPFREGLAHPFSLPARGFQRFEIPIAKFPKGVNRGDIAIIHFFTQRPGSDLALYLDNLVLLRKGESLPPPGAAFARQLGELARQAVADADKVIQQCREAAAALADTEVLRASVQAHLGRFEAQLARVRTDLAAADLTLDRLTALQAELGLLPGQTERTLSVIRFQKACAAAGLPCTNLLVGIATSMEKVPPRDAPFEVRAAAGLDLSLAGNEKESAQVLVLPVSGPARKVSVRASDLQGPGGAVFPRDRIQCDVMGYVQTKTDPPYHTPYIGWWPDPILNFLGPVEIAAGDLQSFWIRLAAPAAQAPGSYHGTLTVSAEGLPPVQLALNVRVFGFALPVHSPLPVAITFAPQDHPQPETEKAQARWRENKDYPCNAWRQHKREWADFLADYYINYDSLYRQGPPDYDLIKRLHEQGRLVAFNLGIFDGVAGKKKGGDATNALVQLRQSYAQAKALGVLNHAYIYGFDECKPEQFQALEDCAQTLRREFPEALLMTTSYDHSYGLDTVVKTINAWCPLTPSFNPEQAAKARADGRWVWWYICCGPHHPHANMFIEYPAIEGRLLMGAMTARQQPDGFLYYEISIWNAEHVITRGPFTDWDPRSWTVYHGDGSWTCAGPDGLPLPTIRLENFRDGLEDYAYTCILQALVRECEAKAAALTPAQTQWLAEAKAALAVPATLVKSMTEYSRDPAAVYAWRNRIGDLIDRSGFPPPNPWGMDFGARGFRDRSAQP